MNDEKVQRFEPRMIGIEDRPPEAGMYVSLHGQYVLHSAYADLAAELATYKADTQKLREILGNSPAAKLVIELDTVRAEKKAAESQLAELRGKCEGLADAWDAAWAEGYMTGDATIDAATSNRASAKLDCAEDIRRALAAADGG